MILGCVIYGGGGFCMDKQVFWRYRLTQDQKARTVRSWKRDSCARLSINVLELLGNVMNAYVMTVVRGDGPERERKSVLMRGDNISAVNWVQQCHRGKDAVRAGRLMRLLGVLEDPSDWCFQAKHVNGFQIRWQIV